MICPALASRLDLELGVIEGGQTIRRHLAELQGVFADVTAFDAECARGNPLVYTVSSVDAPQGEGQLHYGLGLLRPGKVGEEFYLTKGHLHAWRCAAEVYVGLKGAGLMLLENDERSWSLPLVAQSIVYVPGHTAHRTVNTGREPLVYLGIYPAAAGHDYAPIAHRNFRQLVVERNGRPVVLNRADFKV
jgi:glucose-6-phosphate isomerase, archaeal